MWRIVCLRFKSLHYFALNCLLTCAWKRVINGKSKSVFITLTNSLYSLSQFYKTTPCSHRFAKGTFAAVREERCKRYRTEISDRSGIDIVISLQRNLFHRLGAAPVKCAASEFGPNEKLYHASIISSSRLFTRKPVIRESWTGHSSGFAQRSSWHDRRTLPIIHCMQIPLNFDWNLRRYESQLLFLALCARDRASPHATFFPAPPGLTIFLRTGRKQGYSRRPRKEETDHARYSIRPRNDFMRWIKR